MLMVRANHGVCSACVHELTCTHPRDLENPPLECAEFELGFRSDDPANGAPRTNSVTTRVAEPADAVNFQGLCVNCDERATCTYPKPEGGVWQCEDYR